MFDKIIGLVKGAVGGASASLYAYLLVAGLVLASAGSGYLVYKLQGVRIAALKNEVAVLKNTVADHEHAADVNAATIKRLQDDVRAGNATCDTRLGILRAELKKLRDIDNMATGKGVKTNEGTALDAGGDPILRALTGMFDVPSNR